MVSKKMKVVNSQGFHMRPVTDLVKAMGKYDSDVKIIAKGNEIIPHMGHPQIPHHGILTINHDDYTVFKAVKIYDANAFFR